MIEFDGMTFDTPDALFMHGFKTARKEAIKVHVIGSENFSSFYCCSECERRVSGIDNYCSHCGAKLTRKHRASAGE